MSDITVTVTIRDSDVALFDELTEREFRARDGQASYMLQAALQTAQARANAPARPARTTSRRPANGVAVAH